MEHLAVHLAAIPGVVAVTLGGSRATNTAVEGSDWDVLAAAQGRLAAAGEWALNEKRIVERAGVGGVQERLGEHEPGLRTLVADVRESLGLRDSVWIDE